MSAQDPYFSSAMERYLFMAFCESFFRVVSDNLFHGGTWNFSSHRMPDVNPVTWIRTRLVNLKRTCCEGQEWRHLDQIMLYI